MNEPQNPTTIDLDLSSLLDMEGLVRAAESEDDLGCVLRCHFVLERTLQFYLAQKRVGDVAIYVPAAWKFAQALSFCVAFGLPPVLAACYKHINTTRNSMAHGQLTILTDKDVAPLAQCVNRMAEIVPAHTPVEQRFISIHKLHQGVKVAYGQAGARMDFLICSIALLQHATDWMSRDAIRHHMGNETPDWV